MKAERLQNFENGTKMGRQRYRMGYVWKQITEDLESYSDNISEQLIQFAQGGYGDLQGDVINGAVSACILSNVDLNVKGTFLFMRLRGRCFLGCSSAFLLRACLPEEKEER